MRQEITFDKFIRWAGIALLVFAVLYMVNYLSAVLLPFFVAWFLAYLTYPLVKFIQYKLHVKVRALAIVIAMLFVVGIIAGVFMLVIPPMFEQFDKLQQVLIHWVKHTTHTNSLTALISNWIAENQSEIERFFHIIASMITLLYMFFILQDYEYLTDNWIRIFPKKNRPFWRVLSSDVARELNNYIRGQGTVALIMGIMFCIGFTIMDFPMAIGLGIMIGLMDLIPYLHTFALIPTAFLAMLKSTETGQNFWMVFGLAVGLFAVVQIITDMIVTPKVMGKAMGLNPAILLLSLSIWGALLGFIGLIIALPLTTLIIAYWQRYVTRETPIEDNNKEKHDK